MKILRIFGLFLLAAIPSYGQTTVAGSTTIFSGTTGMSVTVGPQWSLVAHTTADHTCTNTNTCAVTIPATGTGHALVIMLGFFNSNNDMTFSSVTGGGGSWANCSICHGYSSNVGTVIAYNLSPSSGVTSLTINLTSANNAAVGMGIDIIEFAWSGGASQISFDIGGHSTSTCTAGSCTGTALTLGGTNDAIFQMAKPGELITAISGGAGYSSFKDFMPITGNGYAGALETSDGTAPTWTNNTPGDATSMAAIAFTNTGGGGGSSYTLLAHKNAGATSSGGTATTAAMNCAGANLITIETMDGAASTSDTVTDSSGNTWGTNLGSFAGSSIFTTLWYVFNPTVSSSQTFSSTGNFTAIFAQCWSGAISSPLDQTVSVGTCVLGSSSTSCQPGNITSSVSNELFITFIPFNQNTVVSVDSSFTIADQFGVVGGQHFGGAVAYLASMGSSSQNPKISWVSGATSSQSPLVMTTFKP